MRSRSKPASRHSSGGQGTISSAADVMSRRGASIRTHSIASRPCWRQAAQHGSIGRDDTSCVVSRGGARRPARLVSLQSADGESRVSFRRARFLLEYGGCKPNRCCRERTTAAPRPGVSRFPPWDPNPRRGVEARCMRTGMCLQTDRRARSSKLARRRAAPATLPARVRPRPAGAFVPRSPDLSRPKGVASVLTSPPGPSGRIKAGEWQRMPGS